MIRMVVQTTELGAAFAQLDRVRKALIREVSREGDEIKRLFEQVVKHWDKSKFAGFTKVDKVDANEITSTAGSDDLILFFINGGTSERFAIMSGDWVSQTTPRLLTSQPGQGKVIARGRRLVPNPMPGIEARHFDEEIVKQRTPIFLRNLEASIIVATKTG